MKYLPFILLVALVGCVHKETSIQTAARVQRSIQQVQHWVPNGTPQASARQIMEQHHFICSDGASFDNAAEDMIHTGDPDIKEADKLIWKTDIVKNSQHFAVTNVAHLWCERNDCVITLYFANGETVGFRGVGRL
jgi:hypothetical protein